MLASTFWPTKGTMPSNASTSCSRGMMPVIPPRSNRKAGRLCRGPSVPGAPSVGGSFINKILHYRRIFPGRSWTPIPGLPEALHRRSIGRTHRRRCRETGFRWANPSKGAAWILAPIHRNPDECGAVADGGCKQSAPVLRGSWFVKLHDGRALPRNKEHSKDATT